ncbi:MAG: site-specific DNA-methyltransferase [Clostridia bacterium]|nr:site-specific DNA-methyltransferase [Clostridia bacterium]
MNSITDVIHTELDKNGIVVLPPMDVFSSIQLLKSAKINVNCTILDPWYNKGYGGVLPDEEYDLFIRSLLNSTSEISDIMYLWGFPEVIGPYVRYSPQGFKMSAWLTWYYKNCPSVIRGWRSSQNACLQFTKNGYALYPENFLEGEQKKKYLDGKMRFVPGPSSVIEEPLIIGFVGKKEKTGHPSQKPERVFDKLVLMSTKSDDIVFDPMCGSGTSGASAIKYGRKCILCDMNDEYIRIVEKRLGVERIKIN